MRSAAIQSISIMVLLAMGLVPAAQAGPPAGDRPRDLDTAERIEVARARGEIDAETASLYLAYALAAPEKLPARYQSDIPWDGTLPLLRLRQTVVAMGAGAARAEIMALLTGICDDSIAVLPNVRNSTHFHIQYGTIGGGLTIDDYAASLDQTWETEIVDFGWAAPPVSLSNPSPGDLYHVRIDSLEWGLYGFVSSQGTHAGLVGDNPNTAWNDVDAYASCMVLNRDYDPFPGTVQQALLVTVAHEFNHSIQFGYGALSGNNIPDDAFIEGSASWMEDEVFDTSNDNYDYLWPTFAMCMGQYTASPYEYWITFRGMTERYGSGKAGGGEQVMQDFWEETSKSSSSNMLSALNSGLAAKGTTLASAFHAYAIAVKFNKACGGGTAPPYCLEEGPGYVAAAGPTALHGAIAVEGGDYNGSVADNYALNWIGLPTGSDAYRVALRNTATGGLLRGSMVCDSGAGLIVTPFPAVLGPGASTSLSDYDPSGCSSVVAVVTNEAQTADNPTACTARSYRLETGVAPILDNRAYLPLVLRNTSAAAGGIANGDFELGPVDWQESSTNGFDLILPAAGLDVAPHDGNWAAWLGGDTNEISTLGQQVMVPASNPHLAYWHWIESYGASCGGAFGRVLIDGTVQDEYDLCLSTDTGGWVLHVVDLGAYAGQTVNLEIQAETNSIWFSSLFVDDVTFQ